MNKIVYNFFLFFYNWKIFYTSIINRFFGENSSKSRNRKKFLCSKKRFKNRCGGTIFQPYFIFVIFLIYLSIFTRAHMNEIVYKVFWDFYNWKIFYTSIINWFFGEKWELIKITLQYKYVNIYYSTNKVLNSKIFAFIYILISI